MLQSGSVSGHNSVRWISSFTMGLFLPCGGIRELRGKMPASDSLRDLFPSVCRILYCFPKPEIWKEGSRRAKKKDQRNGPARSGYRRQDSDRTVAFSFQGRSLASFAGHHPGTRTVVSGALSGHPR